MLVRFILLVSIVLLFDLSAHNYYNSGYKNYEKRCPLLLEFKMVKQCIDRRTSRFYTIKDRNICIQKVEDLTDRYDCYDLKELSKKNEGQESIFDFFEN